MSNFMIFCLDIILPNIVANFVLPTPVGPIKSREIHLLSLYPNFILLAIIISFLMASF